MSIFLNCCTDLIPVPADQFQMATVFANSRGKGMGSELKKIHPDPETIGEMRSDELKKKDELHKFRPYPDSINIITK